MRIRHTVAPAPLVRERQRIESKLRPSARELFPPLRERLLASRLDGAPIFRNVIEDGVHR